MSTVTVDIAEQLAARKRQYDEQFEELILQIYAGDDVDIADAEQRCRNAGKDDRDISNAVGNLRHRDSLRSDLAQIAADRARIAELRGLIEASNNELEQRVAEHQTRCYPWQYEIQQLQYPRLNEMDIRRQLRESAPEEKRREVRLLTLQIEKLHARSKELQHQIHRHKVELNEPRTNAEQRKLYAERIERFNTELSGVSAEQARLQQSISEIEREMLK